MSKRKLPRINRLTASSQRYIGGGKYDFVFSSDINDWCRNKQLETKRSSDKRRYNENGQRRHAR